MVNLLAKEMQLHLQIRYEVTECMTRILQDNIDGNDDEKNLPPPLVVELLKTACKVYTLLTSLRIDPGVIDPGDYYYNIKRPP